MKRQEIKILMHCFDCGWFGYGAHRDCLWADAVRRNIELHKSRPEAPKP